MIHQVKSGETLSKIAKVHKVTLAQLLDANPKFKDNPDLIRVGDVLNIPEGQAASVSDSPLVQPQPQPQPAAERVLGKLSEKFETSGRGPGTVSGGKGDPGGASYGSYQMTSKPNGGTVKRFVSQPDFPFGSRFTNLTPGSSEFTAVWKELASSQREEFQRSQHDFIKKTHFDPLVQKIINEDKINVLTRSNTLQDVIWSTAVQHGSNSRIPHRALSTLSRQPEDADFDKHLITAIYHERGRKNANGNLAHFPRCSAAVQQSVAKRFERELKDALEMLKKETSD